MKKAILRRFFCVLILALIISSGVSYYIMSKQILKDNIRHMSNMIYVMDYYININEDFQSQVDDLKRLVSQTDRIRITIVSPTGVVYADTETEEVAGMENHLAREEIQAAIRGEIGYSTRTSETFGTKMLYVAGMSHTGEGEDYIIRVAIPYTGFQEYMANIFPVLAIGFLVAMIASAVIGLRFTETITRPLQEISGEMTRAGSSRFDFHFKHYKYPELNIISDTTVKLSKSMEEYLERVEKERKIRQEFFSNASHELKTPITAIKGYAELLEQGFVNDEDTKKKFIRRIRKSADNMTVLINDILMISQLETKEAKVTFSMVRMTALVEEILESVEPLADRYQVTLHSECEPIIIEASTKQLRELLVNLISNGIKYNHPEGNVWICISKKETDLFIEIKDDGMGIPTEDQSRIFERFYRVDKGRSRTMGGTGLGLSIVKHIVEFYDGTIQLESKLGQGSYFMITIPLERKPEEIERNRVKS